MRRKLRPTTNEPIKKNDIKTIELKEWKDERWAKRTRDGWKKLTLTRLTLCVLQLGHLFRFHAMLGKSSCVFASLHFFYHCSSRVRVITVRNEAHFRQLNGFFWGIRKKCSEHLKKCSRGTEYTHTHKLIQYYIILSVWKLWFHLHTYTLTIMH